MIYLLLLFSQVQGVTAVTIVNNASGVNLYFLDEGFLDVARGSGIKGASINPAALGKSSGLCFYMGMGGTRRNYVNTSFTIDPGEFSDSIVIPLSLGYEETGGLDYFGVAKGFGPIGIGFAYQRGFELGVKMNSNQRITQYFHYVYEGSFTSEDDPNIPEGDTIKVSIPLEGIATDSVNGLGSVIYRELPFFIGAGFGAGPFNMGIGLKVMKTSLYGDLRFTFMGMIDSVWTYVDTTVEDAFGRLWTIDSVQIVAHTVNDTLFFGGVDGNYYGTRLGFEGGFLLDLKYLKIGLAYERTNQFMLRGAYVLFYGFPNDVPEFEIDTSGLNADSTIRRVWGRVGLYAGQWPMDREDERERTPFTFYPVNRFRVGLYLNLPMFRFSAGANYDMLPWELCFGEFYFGGSVGLPIPYLDTRIGLAGKILYLRPTPDQFIPTQPNLAIGLSSGADIGHFTIDFALRMNLTQGILSGVSEIQGITEEGDFHVDPLSGINFGIGIGAKL